MSYAEKKEKGKLLLDVFFFFCVWALSSSSLCVCPPKSAGGRRRRRRTLLDLGSGGWVWRRESFFLARTRPEFLKLRSCRAPSPEAGPSCSFSAPTPPASACRKARSTLYAGTSERKKSILETKEAEKTDVFRKRKRLTPPLSSLCAFHENQSVP